MNEATLIVEKHGDLFFWYTRSNGMSSRKSSEATYRLISDAEQSNNDQTSQFIVESKQRKKSSTRTMILFFLFSSPKFHGKKISEFLLFSSLVIIDSSLLHLLIFFSFYRIFYWRKHSRKKIFWTNWNQRQIEMVDRVSWISCFSASRRTNNSNKNYTRSSNEFIHRWTRFLVNKVTLDVFISSIQKKISLFFTSNREWNIKISGKKSDVIDSARSNFSNIEAERSTINASKILSWLFVVNRFSSLRNVCRCFFYFLM